MLAKASIQEKQFRFLGTRGVPAREKTHHPQHPSGGHPCVCEDPGTLIPLLLPLTPRQNKDFVTLDTRIRGHDGRGRSHPCESFGSGQQPIPLSRPPNAPSKESCQQQGISLLTVQIPNTVRPFCKTFFAPLIPFNRHLFGILYLHAAAFIRNSRPTKPVIFLKNKQIPP